MRNATAIPYDRVVYTETHITLLDCCTCGVTFGFGTNYENQRRKDHDWFYCPNGHPQHYSGPTELEKERDRLKRDLEWAKSRGDSWKDQAEAAEARRRGQKAANTKLKKRIANGVCPCCHRSFQNVERHMKGQHPDYAKEPESI